jgi:hypothetical protein
LGKKRLQKTFRQGRQAQTMPMYSSTRLCFGGPHC